MGDRRPGLARGIAAALLAASAAGAGAQITADGTMGTVVGRSGSAWSITAGTQLGGNLFHSFSQFGVASGESATFSGAGTVQNIVARVTGTSPSLIDGLLQSSIPGASLWLINPRGVAFGPGASLDVQGAFHVATADFVRLGTSGTFHASNPAASTLAIAPPSAFGFLGTPQPIGFLGSQLAAAGGQRISASGGGVLLAGASLSAPGGRVDLVSLGSAGEVAIEPAGTSVSGAGAYGFAGLVDSSIDSVSGSGLGPQGVSIRADALLLEGASRIRSRVTGAPSGGELRLALTGELVIRDTASVETQTFGGGTSGAIAIDARNVVVIDSGRIRTESFGGGRSGDVTLRASESIVFQDGGQANGTLDSGGATGTITLEAPLVEVRGGAVDVVTFGSGGTTGPIRVRGGSLLVSDGGWIKTLTYSGTGGAIDIDVSGEAKVSGALGTDILNQTLGTGTSGGVSIRAGRLVVEHDGQIGSVSNAAGGTAGSVVVRAGRIELSGDGMITASAFGGTAGEIDVRADELLAISAPSLGLAGLHSATYFGGNAGAIRVTAPRVTMAGGNINSSSTSGGSGGSIEMTVGSLAMSGDADIAAISQLGGGAGGSISITASGSVVIGPPLSSLAAAIGTSVGSDSVGAAGNITLRAGSVHLDGRAISSSSNAAAAYDAGDIFIDAGRELRLSGGASISTTARFSDGGDITLRARDLVLVRDSRITTEARSGTGGGGNIGIDPQLVVLDNGRIVANAFGGPGGNIDIVAGNFLADEASVVSASSLLGVSGTVEISAPEADLAAGTGGLASAYLPDGRLQESCSARAGRGSSFMLSGRGGLPDAPLGPADGGQASGLERRAGAGALPGELAAGGERNDAQLVGAPWRHAFVEAQHDRAGLLHGHGCVRSGGRLPRL